MSYIAANRHWNWRCSREKCKARYSGPTHPDSFKREWKCKQCGGSKFRIIPDRAVDRCATLCDCRTESYQWAGASGFAPHRRGARACAFNADGTLRPRPPREQSERLHPQAYRQRVSWDHGGIIFWFYDGEMDYEAAWARGVDPFGEGFGWIKGLPLVPDAAALSRECGASSQLARELDGSEDTRHAAVG